MQLIGIRLDKETQETVKYELNVNQNDISCLYKDRYGVYVCTHSGRMYKVDYKLNDLEVLCL